MKKYGKTIGKRIIQERITVDAENVKECVEHYRSQGCDIIGEEQQFDNPIWVVDIMYYKK